MVLPMTATFPEKLLTPAEYASLTRRTVQAVAHERCRGGGPAYVKLGRKVFYDLNVVHSFLQQHLVSSTAEAERS
jgi:hypothetical protein